MGSRLPSGGTPHPFPVDEPITKKILAVAEVAHEPPTLVICPNCHGGGRVTFWGGYVREMCDLCFGDGMVPAFIDAAWNDLRRWTLSRFSSR